MARKLRDEDLRLNIIVNGDGGRKQILDTQKAVSDLNVQLTRERDLLREMEKTGIDKSRPAEYQRQKDKVDKLNQSLAAEKSRLDSLTRQQKVSTMTMSELSRHIRLTTIALKNAVPGTSQWKALNAELAKSKARMKELGDQSKSTGGVLASLSKVRVGVAAGVAAAAGVIRAVGSAVSKIADFEQANANLSTIIGRSVDQISGLTDSALELGRTTEYTASQVTQLQTELAKLGFKEADIRNMQEPVLHFATALGTDLPEAAALAGATLRMFGLRSEDTEDALGVLVKGANNSALSFSYLQSAMSTVGPVAKTFGLSLRDVVALLGTLANSGFDASSAATATRNILLNLADSSGKLATALGKPVRTFPEIMEGLRSLRDSGVDLNTTLELTDKRSVSAFNSFLDGADSAMQLRDSLDDVNGVLKETAETRMDTVNGSIKLLQSAWEGFILSMSSSKGAIKDVIDFLTDSINKANDLLFPQNKRRQYLLELYSGMSDQELEKEQGGIDRLLKTPGGGKFGRFLFGSNYKFFGLPTMSSTIYGGDRDGNFRVFDRADLELQRDVLAEYLAGRNRQESPGGTGDGAGAGSGGGTGGAGGKTGDENGGDDKTWSLSSDEAYLKARAELIAKYNAGEIASQEALDEELYNLEVASHNARLATGKDSGAKRARIEADMQEAIRKHADAARKSAEAAAKAAAEREKQRAALANEGAEIVAAAHEDETARSLAAEDVRYEAERKKFAESEIALENHDAIMEAIERKHQNNMLKIRLAALDKSISQEEKSYKTDRASIENKYKSEINNTDSGIEKSRLTRKMNEDLVAKDLNYLTGLKDRLLEIVSTGEYDGVKLNDEQLLAYRIKLQEVIGQINTATAKGKELNKTLWSGTGKGTLFGVSQSQWDQLFANLQAGKLGAADLQAALNAASGAASEGFKIASSAIEMTNAQEDKAFKAYQKQNEEKKKTLEKRLNAGLVTQDQYNAEVEAMEEEEEAKEEEMQLRQARRSKALKLAQSIINTSLGVTKTLAEWGIPWGIAPAAIMAALGAAQTAMIAATPVTTGAAEGGYVDVTRSQDGRRYKARLSPDKRGFVDSPTVLVGEEGGEYVIPADGVNNPALRPFLATIERARRDGTLRSISLPAADPQLAVSVARASGGYTSAPSGSGSGDRRQTGGDSELLSVLSKLDRRLNEPIEATMRMTGRGGFEDVYERRQRQKSRGLIRG